MVPIKTSVDDIEKLLGYLGKQIGWVETSKVDKALGSVDDRKLVAMVEFGLVLRDGGNVRTTERGELFNSDPQGALREVLGEVALYRATLEWVHYGTRIETTTSEIGQYWEGSHKDSLGDLSGSTLGSGAVTFGRIVEGAGLGKFMVGRGGKATRITFDSPAVDALVNASSTLPAAAPSGTEVESGPSAVKDTSKQRSGVPASSTASIQGSPPGVAASSVSVSASPSVHVNVEIHIAADATASTVREIFKNMARYVFDKPVTDDDE